jgi:predicted anti-sigma-YlaC factor YlaD
MKPALVLTALAALAAASMSSCTIIGAASKIQPVLTGEEDPDLVAGALPTFILGSEALLEADPKSQDKVVTTASLFVMYANAFVQGPASILPDGRFEEKQAAFERAGALYRRAFRLLSGALDRRSPGIVEAAVDGKADWSRMRKADVPMLYWGAASVLAGFALNPVDFKIARYLALAPQLLARAAELDPAWNGGAIYGIYVSYYAGLPDYLGGSMAKAEEAYAKALRYSKGGNASLFVTYATAVCVPKEDLAGYKAALGKALAFDPAANPANRLETVLAQRSAKRLLAETDKYFIESEGETTP